MVNEIGAFLSNGVNKMLLGVWIIGFCLVVLNIYSIINLNTTKSEILNAVQKVEKKVDYRYFNLTNSLQGIHKVKIDTHHGEVK